MQSFQCACGQVLFFDNTQCVACQRQVGYDPASRSLREVGDGTPFLRCANSLQYGVCNWLIPATRRDGTPTPPGSLCRSCRYNRTIPDTTDARLLPLWARLEAAKRRLLVTLWSLGMHIPTQASDPEGGLAFDLVSSRIDPQATMGHLHGVITVDLEEADDVFRHINRTNLGEDIRTLLGHFRHESGHYVWARWQNPLRFDDPQRAAFRQRFGSELEKDYPASLQRHYTKGPPPDWRLHFISAYATSHPWEDWAESWNYYLEMADGLETANALGLQTQASPIDLTRFPAEAAQLPPMLSPEPEADAHFLTMLHRWAALSTVLNEISQSLGQPPLTPQVLSVPIAQKLRLIHWLVGRTGLL
ncbi:MAG: putative zinc-binding metallopeptidase [Verrucomicrobiales bacterium]|nr:putative zinc-binding metallopeptidase [Verrucomicrobiales bacterium]